MSRVASRSEREAAGQGGGTSGRRGATASIRTALRDLSTQLSLLNHHVGARLELKDADVHCLDLIDRFGPLTPTALAQSSGMHPATLTGILNRLEKGGWIARERDREDRRAVILRSLRDRRGELLGLYAPMNDAVAKICAGYDDAQLDLLTDFLARAAAAGREANDGLRSG